MKTSLTDRQIEQILRYRSGGIPYKEIARRVNCTPDQVIHYWRTSARYKPSAVKSKVGKQREAVKKAVQQKQRHEAAKAREAAKQQRAFAASLCVIAQRAADELKAEIAQAVQEATSAPLYKPGDLRW